MQQHVRNGADGGPTGSRLSPASPLERPIPALPRALPWDLRPIARLRRAPTIVCNFSPRMAEETPHVR